MLAFAFDAITPLAAAITADLRHAPRLIFASRAAFRRLPRPDFRADAFAADDAADAICCRHCRRRHCHAIADYADALLIIFTLKRYTLSLLPMPPLLPFAADIDAADAATPFRCRYAIFITADAAFSPPPPACQRHCAISLFMPRRVFRLPL
jgi:hypothetical protein